MVLHTRDKEIQPLLYPFQTTPVLLVFFSSALFTFIINMGFVYLMLMMVVVVLLLVSISKYLFAVIENTANGRRQAPVYTYQMLSALWEPKAIQLTLVVMVFASIVMRLKETGIVADALVLAGLFLLPAHVVCLVLFGFWRSINPLAIFGFISRMSWNYLLMTLMLSLVYFLVSMFVSSGFGLFVSLLVFFYSLVMVSAWMGKLVYEQRHEIGFHAMESPEVQEQKELQAEQSRRNQVINQVYNLRKSPEQAMVQLQEGLKEEPNRRQALRWYHEQMMQWDVKKVPLANARLLIRELKLMGLKAEVDRVVDDCRKIDPEFREEP